MEADWKDVHRRFHATASRPENLPMFGAFQKLLNPLRKRGTLLGRKHNDLRFAFNRVFDRSWTQQVFEESVKDIVEGVLNGVNCSVFTYGATGAVREGEGGRKCGWVGGRERGRVRGRIEC